jgi:hypothetical protein
MSRTLDIDETTRLAGRAMEAVLAIASATPTRSIGDEIRRSIATTARRVVIDAAIRSEERRRAEQRRRILRAIVAASMVGAFVAARHRSSRTSAE